MSIWRASGVGFAIVTLLGWSFVASGTTARSPTAVAADMERVRCGPDVDESLVTEIFEKRLIEGATPINVNLGGGSTYGPQNRLSGAFIVVRPVEGMTPAVLDRALECHSAKRVLGRIPADAFPNDPFWLPGGVVDIDVQSQGDRLWIAVRAETPEQAQEILRRARAFVATRAPR
jgi:hypothetical protein